MCLYKVVVFVVDACRNVGFCFCTWSKELFFLFVVYYPQWITNRLIAQLFPKTKKQITWPIFSHNCFSHWQRYSRTCIGNVNHEIANTKTIYLTLAVSVAFENFYRFFCVSSALLSFFLPSTFEMYTNPVWLSEDHASLHHWGSPK